MKTEAKESIKKSLSYVSHPFNGIEHQILCQNRRTLSGRCDRSGTLIQRAADMFLHITIPYTIVNILLNAIPVYIGFRFIGKNSQCIPV